MKSGNGHRKRLPRAERERLIVEEAVRFFAEVGFEGQTRALAERLGVTQPLLYRYFADKEALIERVFDEVFLRRWRPEWETLLSDRSRPLSDRLIDFYQNYCRTIFTPEWIRIFMFAGLKGEIVNKRYFDIVFNNVLKPFCTELRHDMGLPTIDEKPISEAEVDLAWALHGSISYIALRKWIYKLSVPDNVDPLIAVSVSAFMQGSGDALKQIVAAN
ncbi:TetR/AcrR family transcriptional regulator [Telmatospirillum sp.]|uniref:TetR/AcrR family transcriptional regulator n=1 Tax=Telmatospirillum sp. TaxID=2079197 RepID=UPI00284F0417|nr:TetR/AcrR family transcriptional regulator [Telmatospirillum sp.]MDR3439315.1 TetR/AcrR family transcriptional regulator [Telmatospirillum sp.]